MRASEAKAIADILLSGKSLLVLGEPGSGKSTLATEIKTVLEDGGYIVGMVAYAGSANDLLKDLCRQFDIDLAWEDDNGKSKQKTATMLKADLRDFLKQNRKTCLVGDDAHRWSASLRYCLEDCWRSGALLLLLAWQPPPKDIFAKLPVFELKPIADQDIRELIRQEAESHRITLTVKELAELQSKAGNNPAIAIRTFHEAVLGLVDEKSSDHYQYVDGTPLFLVGLLGLGTVRLVGLGLGDKALYILGGLLTLATLAIRMMLYAANRGGRKL